VGWLLSGMDSKQLLYAFSHSCSKLLLLPIKSNINLILGFITLSGSSPNEVGFVDSPHGRTTNISEMVDFIWTGLAKIKENKFPFSVSASHQFKHKEPIIALSRAHQQAGVNVKVCGGKSFAERFFCLQFLGLNLDV
jgi:hypothetical protein